MRRLPLLALSAAIALTGCGGGDAGPSTDGASACLKAYRGERDGQILGGMMSPELQEMHNYPIHVSARIARLPQGCALAVYAPDRKHILQRHRSISGHWEWQPRDPTIGPDAATLLSAAHKATDAIDGTIVMVPILTAREDPKTGAFTPR